MLIQELKKLDIELDSNDNIIKFGDSEFEIFLMPIDSLAIWEGEESEIKTWHIFLKFINEYDKDPSRYISYKFLNQTGDFRNKIEISKQLKNLYNEVINNKIKITKKDLDKNIWTQYEQLIFHKNF